MIRIVRAVLCLFLIGAGTPDTYIPTTKHPCGDAVVNVEVYHALWCADCLRIRALLERYRVEYGYTVTEYIVEDRRGKVLDPERQAELVTILGGSGFIYYPYISVCGKSVMDSKKTNDEELRQLLRIPIKE